MKTVHPLLADMLGLFITGLFFSAIGSLLLHCYEYLRYGSYFYLDHSTCGVVGVLCSGDTGWLGIDKTLLWIGDRDVGWIALLFFAVTVGWLGDRHVER
jgi:hypothetical protein